jgi:alanyl-tRNA synthetase
MDLDEVTLIEDVWAGGGNLGSSIEMFAYGLEIGNMVFTRFKYFPDGSLEEL